MSAARAAAVATRGSASSPASRDAAERVPLVGREPDELHPSVATCDHPEEAVAAALAPERDTVVVEPAQARAVERELRLLHRDVDALPPPRPQTVIARGEHGDGRVPPRVVLGDIGADLHGCTLREHLPTLAARKDGALAAGVEGDQVVGSEARVRAGEAERCDHDHGRRLVALAERDQPAAVGDDDVALRCEHTEPLRALGPVGNHDARLAGVQVRGTGRRARAARRRAAAGPTAAMGGRGVARP